MRMPVQSRHWHVCSCWWQAVRNQPSVSFATMLTFPCISAANASSSAICCGLHWSQFTGCTSRWSEDVCRQWAAARAMHENMYSVLRRAHRLRGVVLAVHDKDGCFHVLHTQKRVCGSSVCCGRGRSTHSPRHNTLTGYTYCAKKHCHLSASALAARHPG